MSFNVKDIVCRKNIPDTAGIIRDIRSKGELPPDYGIEWFDGRKRITFHSEDDIQIWNDSSTILPIDRFFNGEIGNYASFLRTMTKERLFTPDKTSKGKVLSDQILAFNASRTLFYPYQYKPLVKYISSEKKRVLVCDEVGLGKTVEAGLILLENIARVPTEHVLIVCPSTLREKWAQEMKNRFALEFSILKANDLVKAMKRIANDDETNALFGIISYEAVRSENIMKLLEGELISFDIVIFDEAHRLRNAPTLQHKAAKSLCDISDGVVMLTATPIQLRVEDLISLLRLLLPNEFRDEETTKLLLKANSYIVSAQTMAGKNPPDTGAILKLLRDAAKSPWFHDNRLMEECADTLSQIEERPHDVDLMMKLQEKLAGLNLIGHVYTRTKKREVMTKIVKRNPHALSVELSCEERRIYDEILNVVRATIEIEHPLIVNWIMNNIERRVASCLPAALDYFKEKMPKCLSGVINSSDMEEEDSQEDFQESSEKSMLENSISKFYEVLKTKEYFMKYRSSIPFVDSKANVLLNCIDELRSQNREKAKIIVFASFRKTLLYLSELLRNKEYHVYIIHGSVPVEERSGIIEYFRKDTAPVSILLSSKVGGEGLDLQFTDTIVNYDLPWNPMEVEQRIGRIDRIGQESPVINIYYLFLKDTLEERILNRLYERVGIFEGTIGELEPILGEVVREIMESVFSYKSLDRYHVDEYEKNIARILASHKKALDQLERDSANFIGTDAFFMEEVKRVESKHLYITAEQMRLFFENFLKENCPSSQWEYNLSTKIGIFKPDSDFGKLRQQFFDDWKNIVHRQFKTGRIYSVTFDRDTAYKAQGNVEFIHNLHPLVWLMMKVFEYNQQNGRSVFDSAFHILIEDNMEEFGKGTYIFEIARIEINSYNPYNSLEFAVLGEDECPLPPNKSKELFSYILDNGRDRVMPLPDFEGNEQNRKIIEKYHEKLHDILFKRAEFLKDETALKNSSFLDRRKATLTMTYERKKRDLEEQIETRKSKGESEKTLRLPVGQLHKLEEKYNADIESLEKKRDISVQREHVAFGVLEIV